MKRMISLLLSTALLLALLPACREPAAPSEPPERRSAAPSKPAVQSEPPARQPTALEVVDAMLTVSGRDGQSGNLEYLTSEEDGAGFLAAYIENAYGLPEGTWEDAAVVRAVGASAFELAVLRLETQDEAGRAVVLLTTYISYRRGDFVGYAPEQADMVSNGEIAQDGSYVALCICPNLDQAAMAFSAAVNGDFTAEPGPASAPPETQAGAGAATQEPDYPGRIQFVPPNQDDMSIYDTSAIRAAWESGDPSRLSGYDKDIYNAAKRVLDKVLKDGMSDLEKETAVYSWIVNNVNYDWTHQDVMKETPRESFTPYGGLVNYTAVCLGFATTFQLLMDLAGVECITVAGAAFASREDHGWNMVRLNGNWYCVDVTWDANLREYGATRGRERDWIYFNVTSDEMAATDHQWDYAHTPEAVTGGKGRS